MLSQGEDHIPHKLDVLSDKNSRRRMSWYINILTTPTEYLSLKSVQRSIADGSRLWLIR